MRMMSHKAAKLLCQAEAKRLAVLVTAITAVLIIGFQTFEAPNIIVFPHLFPATNTTISDAEGSPSRFTRNARTSNASNSTYTVKDETQNMEAPAPEPTLSPVEESEISSDPSVLKSWDSKNVSDRRVNRTRESLIKKDLVPKKEINESAPRSQTNSNTSSGLVVAQASSSNPAKSDKSSNLKQGKSVVTTAPEERISVKNVRSQAKTPRGKSPKARPVKLAGKRKERFTSTKKPPAVVLPLSEINDLLIRSHASENLSIPRWPSKVDEDLLYARSQIKNAPVVTKNDECLYPPLYRNVSRFRRSYELMEKILKVYVYEEGDRPIFHTPEANMDGIYASEGWFMKLMESSKRFVTKDPQQAHLFYLAFSSRVLQLKLYARESHKRTILVRYLRNYVDKIIAEHPFWNRTGGSDHFFAACHDWAPAETRGKMLKTIRALCNADVGLDFVVGKDVSLPETKVSIALDPNKYIGGNRPSRRPTLAFFGGSMHGYVRPILLDYWLDRDPDMKIFGRVEQHQYRNYMRSSKFCICAKGYEVNSPRIVEAIMHECVPVIISDNYVPPFLEVLDWESFAVFVQEKDIPDLKRILVSIPSNRYLEMHKRVKMVQKHFLWHDEPVKYDLFHMILHSVWYNRVFQIGRRN